MNPPALNTEEYTKLLAEIKAAEDWAIHTSQIYNACPSEYNHRVRKAARREVAILRNRLPDRGHYLA
jgi:hypothetical protein